MFIFQNDVFSLFHFVLQQSTADMTARWSEIPAAEKTDLIELEMRLVISRSIQWPWTWVGKLIWCFRSKHVRITLNLLVFPFDLPRCKLKSPNIYKLSCSEIMFSSRSWNSSKNWHVQADNEITERIVSDTCRDRFERFKWWQRMNVSFELVRH